MKKLIILAMVALMTPSLLWGQSTEIKSLIAQYTSVDDVDYIEANKAIIWMVKARAPKGSMNGVDALQLLNFKDGAASSSYKNFREQATALFDQLSIECITSEMTKEGLMEVFMRREQNPTESMVFTHNKKGEVMFMWMGGTFPSPAEPAEQ